MSIAVYWRINYHIKSLVKLIESINLNNIRGDIMGGITAAIVVFPFALVMGLASGFGAEAGLYGVIIKYANS